MYSLYGLKSLTRTCTQRCGPDCSYEAYMNQILDKVKLKYERRQLKYEERGNVKKERDSRRILWAINGAKLHKLLINPLRDLLQRFRRLDLIPTHYEYPELYRI